MRSPAVRRVQATGVPYALAAAALFGASTPLAKLLVGHMPPVLLASLLYLGSGVGLGALWLLRTVAGRAGHEAPLTRQDIPWLAGATLAGGVCGPVLLMVGLSQTPGSTSALLLNMEGVFTALLAWFVFKESFDARVMVGMAAIVAGGVVLSWSGSVSTQGLLGPLAVVGACLAWGLDNNLTRKVSGGDPIQVACIKGGVAGSVNLLLALALGATAPPWRPLAAAGLLGFLGYGVSLALFVLSLRHLGAARTGAYFSTAPFLGAVLAMGVLREPMTASLAVAALLMAGGVWLHLTERHEHEHAHHETDHGHRHSHDLHHQHAHTENVELGMQHAHTHRHTGVMHAHPHYPDLHHIHSH